MGFIPHVTRVGSDAKAVTLGCGPPPAERATLGLGGSSPWAATLQSGSEPPPSALRPGCTGPDGDPWVRST